MLATLNAWYKACTDNLGLTYFKSYIRKPKEFTNAARNDKGFHLKHWERVPAKTSSENEQMDTAGVHLFKFHGSVSWSLNCL